MERKFAYAVDPLILFRAKQTIKAFAVMK